MQSALAGHLAAGRSGVFETDCDGEFVRAVCLIRAEPPRMIVVGAVDVAGALSDAAALLGYAVTVVDARPVFATAERFPSAEVVCAWPDAYLRDTPVDERTVICVLTHEDRFATSALVTALALPVGYVGAMGSRRTDRARRAALRDAGVAESALGALHSPIGLDLGGATPAETAVSILAEVLAERSGRTGESLRRTEGSIRAADSTISSGSAVGALREAPDSVA